MAVRPVPSIPCVTSSAVEEAENPDAPFLLNNHIPAKLISPQFIFLVGLNGNRNTSFRYNIEFSP